MADGVKISLISIAKSGDPKIFGNATLSEGANVTLTQVGPDIEIAATGGGGGTPAAPDTSVQFNNAGAFGGEANFTHDPTLLTVRTHRDGNSYTQLLGPSFIIDTTAPAPGPGILDYIGAGPLDIALPDATTLQVGDYFKIINSSAAPTGTVNIFDGALNPLVNVEPQFWGECVLADNTTVAGLWRIRLPFTSTTLGNWILNGNTVFSEKSIGTLDTFDFPIITDGNEVARFTTTGFLGIGITPVLPLHVTITSTPLQVSANFTTSDTVVSGIQVANADSSSPWNLGVGGSVGDAFYTPSSFNIQFGSMDTQAPALTALFTGEVGIGTIVPLQQLTVQGDFGITDGTFFTAFQLGTQLADITYTLPVNDGGVGQLLTTDGAGILSWTTPAGGGDMLASIYDPNLDQRPFWAFDGNTVGVESFIGTLDTFDFPIVTDGNEVARFTTTGFFGVGTPTPDTPISVSGAGMSVGGTFEFNAQFLEPSANNRGINLGFDTANQVGMVYSPGLIGNPSAMAFWVHDGTSPAERMRLLANGNFGINTLTPGQKLTVQGDFGISDGTFFTAFQLGTQAGNITYTLPIDDGDAGEVLTTDGAGVLSWTTDAGGDMLASIYDPNLDQRPFWAFDGNTVGVESFIGTLDNFDFPLRTNNVEVARYTTTGFYGVGTLTPTTRIQANQADLIGGVNTLLNLRNDGAVPAATDKNVSIDFWPINSEVASRITSHAYYGDSGNFATDLDFYTHDIGSGAPGLTLRLGYEGSASVTNNVFIGGELNVKSSEPNLYSANIRVATDKTVTSQESVAFFGTSEVFASNPLGLAVSVVGGATNPDRIVHMYGTEQGLSLANLQLNGLDLIFATGPTTTATEKMRILSNGNVAIGPVGPTEIFNIGVLDTAGDVGIRIDSTGAVEYKIGINDADNLLYITNSDGNAAIGSNTEGIIITTVGDVGINTAAPGQKLTVQGDFGITDGTFFTEFQLGTQAGNITYTLPVDDGDAGDFLKTDGAGVLSWTPPVSYTPVWGSGAAGFGATFPQYMGSAASVSNTSTTSLINFNKNRIPFDGVIETLVTYYELTVVSGTTDLSIEVYINGVSAYTIPTPYADTVSTDNIATESVGVAVSAGDDVVIAFTGTGAAGFNVYTVCTLYIRPT